MAFSLFPRTIYRTKSKISGPIEVKEQLGQHTLHVQGLIQSGGLIKAIWKKALRRITCHVSPIANVLILGLGGGTVVHLIKEAWPAAKITAIEIDPVIIQVAKKHFGLGKVEGLRIIKADALKWRATRKKFDLILVDLYLGDKLPQKVKSERFLKKIKGRLYSNGVAIFNRLRTDKTARFEAKLKEHLSQIEKVKTASNDFFLARR